MRINPETWPELSRLLDQLLDLPPESRPGWLDHLPPEQAHLAPALRQLLAARDTIGDRGFLDTLPRLERAPGPAGFAPGALVGPYRLNAELGQGGMGVVWLAERADGEMRRPVALKLPIVSMYNRALAERFKRERDILAQLNHPCIARLYDAGIAESGQPYLALEYVEGEKITDYCDRRHLALKPRLQLFLQVLRGAQYAHANLIVHRDLKPANILVTGDGEVRLLDFGIAKLMSDGEANETELTRIGGSALTPGYASPEQITGGTVTTASDVYSLGVVLYELLTGQRPYRPAREGRSGFEEAVLTADPVRPSQAAAGVAQAQARGVNPKQLARSLRGDLDTILLKALSKAPAQRYPTADAFAQDIERYLRGEPVLARPESSWYRARKFVRRHTVTVGAVVAVIAALCAGLGIALREARIAQVQTRTAQTVRTFLLDVFRANSSQNADPVKARQTTARELLDMGAHRIDGALNEAPEAKLETLETFFRLYVDLGLQDQAALLGRKRVALARRVWGPHHPEVARALVELAVDSGNSSFAQDRPALLKEAGSILDQNRDFQSRLRAKYYLAMGNSLFRTDLAGTETFESRSVELFRKYPPSPELVSALNALGQAQDHRGEYRQAIVNLAAAIRVAESLQGEARGPLPALYAYLGDAQRHVLDLGGAEKSLRSAVEVARTLKGEDHVDVVQTKYRLGAHLCQTSRPREGLRILGDAVDLAVHTLGPDEFFHTPMVRDGYGIHLLRYGRTEEGVAMLALAEQGRLRGHGRDSHDFINTMEWMASGETDLGHYRKAEDILAEAAGIRSRLSPSSPAEITDSLLSRAGLLVATGRARDAGELLARSPFEPHPAQISYGWLDIALARAEAELARGRPDAAIALAHEVRTRIQDAGLGDYLKRWEARAALVEGKALLFSGRNSSALPLLERATVLGRDVFDPERSPLMADSQVALAKCLVTVGRPGEARPLLARARGIHATHRDLGEQYRRPLRELEALLAR
ncbi:MAG: serine/threonine protein kinase [Acidobacteria bacterium]|nr:serine/threonine protein kinase [Acidobacteriota bacterium]